MGGSYRVLIVDDEEMVTNFISSLFSKYGHHCETAKDGLEALEKIKKNAFDTVITDIVMPQMDGLTLTKELVKRGPNLPIMIMTGHEGEYSAESALKAGAREFIKKPFSFPEFIIRFDKMMRDHETLCRLKEERDEMLFHSQRHLAEKVEKLRKEVDTYKGRWSLYYDPELD
jgi:CheY-like chemotaxis protein